jgi:hypothetical protein
MRDPKLSDDTLQTLLRTQAAVSYLGDYKGLGWVVSAQDRDMLAAYIKDGLSPADAAERVQAETWTA